VRLWIPDKTGICRILFKRGCSVHARDNRSKTPLFFACMLSVDTTVAKLLINHGADIHAKPDHGSSSLQIASGGYGNPLPRSSRHSSDKNWGEDAICLSHVASAST
jgi:hypothetical protein